MSAGVYCHCTRCAWVCVHFSDKIISKPDTPINYLIVPSNIFTTLCAPNHCFMAQKATSSGASNAAHHMSLRLQKKIAVRVSAGAGIFGWTVVQVQVHRKTVIKQLLRIDHVVRWVAGSGQAQAMSMLRVVLSWNTGTLCTRMRIQERSMIRSMVERATRLLRRS